MFVKLAVFLAVMAQTGDSERQASAMPLQQISSTTGSALIGITKQPRSFSEPLTNPLTAANFHLTSLQRLRLSVTVAGQVC